MPRESDHIELTYADVNDLPVCSCEAENACLRLISSEKHYVVCGLEFGLENIGDCTKLVRALCDGKSSRSDY